MIKPLKTLAWIIFFVATAMVVCFVVAAIPGNVNVSLNGQHYLDGVSVSLNGQNLEGTQKIIVGSAGLFVAGIATLAAIGIAVFAVAGSVIVTFVCLALVALVLAAVAIPFMLPIIIPILLLALILMSFRETSNRTQ